MADESLHEPPADEAVRDAPSLLARSPGPFGTSLAWLACLAAAVATPLLLNPHTVRCFEEDKALLLRSLGVLVVAGLLIRTMGGGRADRRPFARLPRGPLPLLALVLVVVCLLATVFSIAPRVAFWGAYMRRQGAVLWLACFAVFVAVGSLGQRPGRIEQLVSAALLASLPCALYAILQRLRLDPVDWSTRLDVAQRVSSTAGNPIFLAAYLIMVVPLTLSRLLPACRGALAGGVTPRERAGPWLRLAAYGGLLTLQLLAVAFTQSRGPLLGLLAGLCFFAMIVALRRGARWAAVAIGAGVLAGGIGLVALNASAAGTGGAVPGLGRLGKVFSPQGTGRARIAYWEGAVRLIAATPARVPFGCGPDTTFLAYSPFHAPKLTHLEGTEAFLDRLHNETFESLVTIGVLGAAAELLLFVVFFRQVLRRLGLVRAGRQGKLFWALVLGCAAAGAVVPFAVEGTFRLSGVGLPGGVAAGVGVYLVWLAVGRGQKPAPQRAEADRAGDLVLAALFAGVMAHFVEIQLCMATVTTRLYWWVYLGMAVALLLRPSRVEAAEAQAGADPDEGRGRTTGAPWALGACTALAMVVLLFGLYQTSMGWRAQAPILALLIGGTWLAGAVALAGGTLRRHRPDAAARCLSKRRTEALARAVARGAPALMVFLLFAAAYVPWTSWRPREAVKLVRFAHQQSHATSLLYAAVFLVVAGFAWRGTPRGGRRADRGRRRLRWAVTAGLLALAAAAAVQANLDSARADSFAKQARFYQRAGQWSAAALLYGEAIRLRPGRAAYVAARGKVLAAEAEHSEAGPATDEQFREATAVLKRAARLAPLDFRHLRALARTYQLWAGKTRDAGSRLRRAKTAGQFYRQAVARIPGYVPLRNEWAGLWLQEGRIPRALAIAEEALEVDDRWGPTRLLLARICREAGDYKAALAQLNEATDAQNVPPRVWHEKAEVLAHLDETDRAVESARKAVEGAPCNWRYRRTLAILYRRSGRHDRAVAEARRAAACAPPAERQSLRRLIGELTTSRTADR